jgi:Rrf2 family nitric oxide-sensitive transcriptional repressor
MVANLLKVSEAASLGLHIMALLAAEPEKLLSVREAASALDVSEAHLAKVLQRLAKAGLVESIRGPRGGFLLARSPEEITLLQVYEAIEGTIIVRQCLFSTKLCDGKKCLFGGMLQSIDSQARQYLLETKLTAVIDAVRGVRRQSANA